MEDFRKTEQYFLSLREKLEYGVYHVVAPLKMEAFISRDPVPFPDRAKGVGKVMLPGEHWGDLFDCAWFHFTGSIPENYKNAHTAVLVDVSAEGLVVNKDGKAIQGLTSATSRNEFPLGLWGKRTIEMKDCLNEHGHIDFWADFTCCDVEGQYRNQGRIKEACVALVDDLCRDAFYDWMVCQSLFVGLCENGDPYGYEVADIMKRAAKVLEASLGENIEVTGSGGGTEALMMGRHDYGTSLEESGEKPSFLPDPETEPTRKLAKRLDPIALTKVRQILQEILSRPCENSPLTYSAMGHSHLDLLFLWPERETYRKNARTMANVLKMMDRFPDYKFCLSQAPAYIWLKEYYPDLYERVLEKIRQKRIEVVGALWIECDTNLPGGEALVRQLLYGKRFFRQELGLDMQVGFLPDVFGYSAALPQLFVKADVPYFTTNKLSMNDTNRFPRYTFWWHGLDGTKILTHMLPENSYTSAAVPQMAIYGQYHYTDMDLCDRGLQLYGLGDGGGGPGYEHMERRQRSRNLRGCPPFEDEFVVDFFHRIERNSERYRSWHGELYFERHQGTYTSIAKQKKWNRTLEQDLHTLEWLAALSDEEYPRQWLKKAWEDVLLYQFHDCLPGSSIPIVYEQTQARYAELHRDARELIEALARSHGKRLSFDGKEPALLMNPTSFHRTERVSCNGKEATVTLAPYEMKFTDLAAWTDAAEETVPDDFLLENDHIRLLFTKKGTVSSVYDKKNHRELLPKGTEGNRLLLWQDELTHWDIQRDYLNYAPQEVTLLKAEKRREGSLTKRIQTFRVGEKSSLTQEVVLYPDSPRVDFRCEAHWQEEYQMLRVQWPVDVVTDQGSCEIQFGHVKRPTHQNTTWDQAKFEVCAHKWADLSDRSGGLALLNDCKYGYKLWDGMLDLCLLRSQNCPAEGGDLGDHSFTYAILPHKGDVWDGGVIREGYSLNYPIECLKATPGSGHSAPWLQILSGTAVLESVKKCEDSDDLILRFYEAAGGSTRMELRLEGYRAVGLTNLLEEPVESGDLTLSDTVTTLKFHPFEVHSLLIQKI